MPTTKQTPDDLRAKADDLAQQAARAQAELDAENLREQEQQQAEQQEADRTMVAAFDVAALDREVDDARQALDQAIADQPVTQALAGYLAAQYLRNWAHGDLMGARGRLGMSTTGGRQSGTTELQSLDELIIAAAQRAAQRHVDAYRAEQQR